MPVLRGDGVEPRTIAAEVLYQCAADADTRIRMRLDNALEPLVVLLRCNSARHAALGALCRAMQNDDTNCAKLQQLSVVDELNELMLRLPRRSGPPLSLARRPYRSSRRYE